MTQMERPGMLWRPGCRTELIKGVGVIGAFLVLPWLPAGREAN